MATGKISTDATHRAVPRRSAIAELLVRGNGHLDTEYIEGNGNGHGYPRPSRLGEVWGSVIALPALPQPKTETIFVHFVLGRKTTFSDRI